VQARQRRKCHDRRERVVARINQTFSQEYSRRRVKTVGYSFQPLRPELCMLEIALPVINYAASRKSEIAAGAVKLANVSFTKNQILTL
jgi:hypothetical protein